MPLITSSRRVVPVARRQLAAQPAKLAASVLAVAAAVALVLLLAGLRRGVAEQATLYLDRQPPVVVGQIGMRDFLSQASVLPERVGRKLERVRGVAGVEPVSPHRVPLAEHGTPEVEAPPSDPMKASAQSGWLARWTKASPARLFRAVSASTGGAGRRRMPPTTTDRSGSRS